MILPFEQTAPRIHPTAFVAPDATVAGNVSIGPGVSLWFGTIIRGDINRVEIGRRTNLQDGTIVHVAGAKTGMTRIGADITVGHRAILHACTLEDGCFIGMGATVMDNVVVGKNAMVAAGALLPPGKRVPAGQLWGGSPARYMRDLTEAELLFMRNNVRNYMRWGRTYRKTISAREG